MRRGTTPTHTFNTNIDLSDAAVLYVTYKQGNEVMMEKAIDDCVISADKVVVHLSQAETLAFQSYAGQVDMQIRARFPDGSAVASNIMTVAAGKILKDGEI